MKAKLSLCAILLSLGLSAQQDADTGVARNELKGNLLFTLLEFPEISYERVLNEEGAIGLSLGFALDSDIDYRFAALPYYRFYFGKPWAKGFFLEVNATVTSVRDSEFIDFNNIVEDNQLLFGMGAAAGVKFMSRSNMVGEVYLGVGRYFNETDSFDWGYPRIGITIGKRFR